MELFKCKKGDIKNFAAPVTVSVYCSGRGLCVCVCAAPGQEAEQERVGGAESAPVQSGLPGKASPIRSSLPQPAENSETLPLR